MYDPRGETLRPIEPEPQHHVHDVVGFDLCEVVDVRPVIEGDRVVCFDVVGDDGAITRGRNLVVATRPTPALPAGIYSSERVWHSSELAPRLLDLPLASPRRFVVVGDGPSAAETTAHLRDRFGDAEIWSLADVADVHETDDDVVVVSDAPDTGETSMLRVDAIVFATGYEPADPGRLLGTAAAYCRRDDRGDLRIGPDHRVQTTEHVLADIYAAPWWSQGFEVQAGCCG